MAESTTASKDSMDASEQADSTLTDLLGGVQDAYASGDTYVGPGTTTQQAWTDSLAAAGNDTWANANNGVTSTVNWVNSNGGLNDGQWADVAGTDSVAADYAALGDSVASGAETDAIKADVTNDTLQATNSAFNSSGMFGSDSNQESAATGVANALAAIDYDNYWKGVDAQSAALAGEQGAYSQSFDQNQQAINNQYASADVLASTYANSQAPATTEAAVGAAQDTAAAADANSQIDWLNSLFGITEGTTSTDSSSSTDWWDQLIGYAISAA